MKFVKYLFAVGCAVALLAGTANIQANCGNCPGEKKECPAEKACPGKKCCEEAKKAGKTCEKCPKKECPSKGQKS